MSARLRECSVSSSVDGIGCSEFICRKTNDFSRACFALICSGFSAFAVLYCIQPALPTLAVDFGVSASVSSLAVSVSTITLAIGLVFTGPLSDALGRKPVMVGSMLAAGILSIISATATDWTIFLVARACLGLVLGGVTAINMTYLTEEIEPSQVGFTVGLMIGGNSLGGMLSRLVVGVSADYNIWRSAIAVLGIMTIFGAALVWKMLPPSRHFNARPLSFINARAGYSMHLHDLVMRHLFFIGFLIMGSFVVFFNYISFHLMAEPIGLSQASVGWLSLVYLLSTVTSVQVGALTDKMGPEPVLIVALFLSIFGVFVSCSVNILISIIGISIFICGFFAAHSVVSGWVGRQAKNARAQATALYQTFFYLGASIVGSSGGYIWSIAEWTGVSFMILIMLIMAAVLTLTARRLTFRI